MNLEIGNRKIGDGERVFIVAELSANHNKDYDISVKTIEAAAKCGVDAVKLQTYTPDIMTLNCDNEYFRINNDTIWDGKTLYELYEEAHMPWEWQPELKEVAEDLGLILFSTPFDRTSADFLEKMDVPAYKISSFEITDISLIEYIASKRKPIILSTGIARLCDIELAINICKKVGNKQIGLLKCASSYPAPPEEMHINSISSLKSIFNTVVGLSDHSLGSNIAIASVALGANIIEKHFILDKKLGGPDAEFSIEPKEFKRLVRSIREVEKSLGGPEFVFTDAMKKNSVFARSIFAIEDIKAGETFSKHNVGVIRPGNGISPKNLKDIIGKVANTDIQKGCPLKWNMIE